MRFKPPREGVTQEPKGNGSYGSRDDALVVAGNIQCIVRGGLGIVLKLSGYAFADAACIKVRFYLLNPRVKTDAGGIARLTESEHACWPRHHHLLRLAGLRLCSASGSRQASQTAPLL